MSGQTVILLDGHAPSPADLDWLLASRALAFGEGVFTSLRVADGQVVFLEDHLWRLQSGLQALRLPLDVIDWVLLQQEMQQLATQQQDGMVKVMLLAGPGGRGYQRSPDLVWHRFLHARPLAIQSEAYQGISCWWQPSPGVAAETSSKHLNRLTQVLASINCPSGYNEALHHDEKGQITEGIARNVFWFAGGCWHTPALAAGPLAGVMRRQILATLQDEGVEEGFYQLQDLLDAEEVLLCNSLQGIWPVTELHGTAGCLARWRVGPQTRRLMADFHPSLGLPLI